MTDGHLHAWEAVVEEGGNDEAQCCELGCDNERTDCGERPQYCETCADFYADEEENETRELALHATT